MAKLEIYAHGETPQSELKTVFSWLKDNQMKKENLWNTTRHHDDLIREMMTRQDRQAKWILFLLVSWAFSGVFLALAMMMG